MTTTDWCTIKTSLAERERRICAQLAALKVPPETDEEAAARPDKEILLASLRELQIARQQLRMDLRRRR